VKLVIDNSEREIQEKYAKAQAEHCFNILAANILRVLRGSGQPYSLHIDAANFVNAFTKAQETGRMPNLGLWPTNAEHMRTLGTEQDRERWREDGSLGQANAEDNVIAGALQVVASRLLDQKSQESKGEHEVRQGIMEWSRIREERRR